MQSEHVVLKELRYQREAAIPALVMDHLNRDHLASALGVAAMRQMALTKLTKQGSIWERPSKGELVGGRRCQGQQTRHPARLSMIYVLEFAIGESSNGRMQV